MSRRVREARAAATELTPSDQCRLRGKMEERSVQVYSGLQAALEKLSSEAAVLAERTKQIGEYNATLERLNTSFEQVQSKLVRVAAVKPGFSKILV